MNQLVRRHSIVGKFIYFFLLAGVLVSPGRAQVTNAKSGQVPYPDNVTQESCSFPVESSDWSIQIDTVLGSGSDGDSVCTLITPLVGDLTGDGFPEIVCFSTRSVNGGSAITGGGNPGTKVKSVLVYNGRTYARIAHFDLPAYVSAFEATPYGLARPYGANALMVFACTDNNLYAFQLNGSGGATQVWGPVSYGSGNDYATTVGFADFNNDSIPEVYVRNKIFNLTTGQLLLTVNSSNQGATYAHVGNSTASGRKPLAASFASDVVGDSHCELLLGNEIHTIQIANPNGTAGNSATLYVTALISGVSGISADGHVQVADFNLDGHLDILHTCRPSMDNGGTVYGYVWDVFNNTVSTPIVQSVTLPGKSIPLIADIDNDDTVEVVLHCGVPGANVRAYKYHADSRTFSLFWTKGYSEDSYSNSLTLFDFNQDGNNELLICDNDLISIVNGSTPEQAQTALSTLAFREVTIMQYPVIADIDNDGAAEIVFVGKRNSQSYQGTLNILRSSGTPWAPARPVWNQYMYNVTQVNKDLTIPAVLFNNAQPFIDHSVQGNTVLRRPFNNFLQQATQIDTNGNPYRMAADLVPGENWFFEQTGDGLILTFEICNEGMAYFITDTLYIHIYADSYRGEHIGRIFSYNLDSADLYYAPGECRTSQVLIPYSIVCPHLPFDNYVFAINDRGPGVAQGGVPPECDSTNNFITLPNNLEVWRDTIYDTVCQNTAYSGYGFEIDASRTSEPGWLVDSLVSGSGCGEVDVLFLLVQSREVIETTVTTCVGYEWFDTLYTESGTYTHIEITEGGCEQVFRLHLIVQDTITASLTVSACDRYEWHGQQLTESGDYFYRTESLAGCDSVVTLHLTVYPSYLITESASICDGYPITLHGETVRETGHYEFRFTSSAGCDSLYETEVSLHSNYTRTDSVRTCIGNSEVGYRWIDGNTYYYSTDEPVLRLTTHDGCDSTLRLHLEIDRSLKAVIHCEPEFPTYDNYHVCVSDITSNELTRIWYLYDGSVSEERVCCFDMPFQLDSVVVKLVVSSSAGCYDTAQLVIPMDRSALYVPNAFTPNLATNSEFRVFGKGLLEMEMTIFNREGLQVFYTDNWQEVWDGTQGGEPCPQGTYVYKIRYRTVWRPDEWQLMVGTVTLFR